jgi:predicted anti-sigma-YlaC factor YlaD
LSDRDRTEIGPGGEENGMELKQEHERQRESIDLATDGTLDAAHRSELEEHLAGCADCRGERELAAQVVERLAAARIAVRPGFAHEVMAALEPAPWEARTWRTWRLPLALFLAIGVASAALVGSGAAAFAPAGGAGGALYALADLFRASLVAGSGLAAASWRAVGAAAGSWLGGSTGNWVAALILVIGVNYLLFRLLRLRRPVAQGTQSTQSATLFGADETQRRR